MVRNACPGIKLGAGVDVHEGGALGHIQDVSHSEFLKAHGVLGYKPEHNKKKGISEVREVTYFQVFVLTVSKVLKAKSCRK